MIRRILALIPICLLVPLAATASTMLALDLGQLTRAADEVVVGEVIGLQAEPIRGGIITRVTVRVEAAVAGRAGEGDELEIVVPGGEFDGIGMLVHGAPRLVHGRQYLLFLRRHAPEYQVVGMAQGAWPLRRASDTGRLMVTLPPNLPGLVRARDGRLEPARPAIDRPTPLDDVILRVREVHHAR